MGNKQYRDSKLSYSSFGLFYFSHSFYQSIFLKSFILHCVVLYCIAFNPILCAFYCIVLRVSFLLIGVPEHEAASFY